MHYDTNCISPWLQCGRGGEFAALRLSEAQFSPEVRPSGELVADPKFSFTCLLTSNSRNQER